MSQSANQPLPISKTTIIDKDGDITMVMGDAWTSNGPRFRVSSSLLSLASPFFRKLLKSYAQGKDANPEPIEVSLHEADIEGMEILLSVLHYHDTEKYEILTPKRLTDVARLSDKYECNKAMRAFATQWLRDFGSDIDINYYGTLLLATWYFNREDLLKIISVGAIKRLPTTFRTQWATEKMAVDLPSKIKDAVHTKILEAQTRLRNEIEAVELRLRHEELAWMTSKMTCPICSRVHPSNAQNCHNCHNKRLFKWLCTKQSRIAEYFQLLSKAQLWPTGERFADVSISQLVARVGVAKKLVSEAHECFTKETCPLKKAMNELHTKTNQILNDIEGVEMHKLREEV